MPRALSAVALALVTAAGLAAGSAGGLAPNAAAAGPDHTLTTLYFEVTVGPEDQRRTCEIVGDLYVPSGATPEDRAPAVLTTNGFGGSKDDQAGMSRLLASRGYVVLSYSGLGFGGSGCDITLDDLDHDGQAAAQLIDFLGGADGIAAFEDEDRTRPVAPLDVVRLDGDPDDQDPRVGMVGGSYGGQVQYAAAAVSDKLDTIVPLITWNDLSYSLAPNNTDQVALPGQRPVGVSTATPGSVKTNWVLGFSGIGLTGDVANQQPELISSRCPNFADFVCPALVTGAVTGTLGPDAVRELRRASVAGYAARVTVPTLILQGQADTLFNLNEAIATYEALKAQGTPVKMSWVEYGHSGAPAEGEIDFTDPDPETQHVTGRILDWFEHHLQDRTEVSTGPEFSWFRDWVDYSGNAEQAYQGADSYPVGSSSTYHLSSSPTSSLTGGSLVTDRGAVTSGSASFVAPPGPVSNGEDLDVIGTFLEQPEVPEPAQEVAGTFARYDTDPLTAPVDVVGTPRVRLQVDAPATRLTQGDDVGRLVLYLKVVDVSPGGGATVVRNLAAPVRVPDVTEPFTVTMPAFAHRFEKGHRVRLLVAGASPNYRGNNAPAAVRIDTAAGEQQADEDAEPLPLQSLTLPTLSGVPASGGVVPAPEQPVDGDGTDGTDEEAPGTPVDPEPGGAAPGSDQAGAGVQASPVAGGPTAPTSTSTALPDTGGPHRTLLAAGALLLLLGAAQTWHGRRTPGPAPLGG